MRKKIDGTSEWETILIGSRPPLKTKVQKKSNKVSVVTGEEGRGCEQQKRPGFKWG